MIVAALQPCQLWSVLVKSRRSRCRWANMMSLKMFKRVTRSPKELSAKTLRIQLEWDSFCCCAKGDNLKVEIKRFSSMPDLTRPCQDQSFADTNTQRITPALNFSHKSIGNCKRQLWLAFMWEGSFSLSLFTLPSSRPIFTGKWFCNELHAELRGLDWSANIYIFFLIYIIYKKKPLLLVEILLFRHEIKTTPYLVFYWEIIFLCHQLYAELNWDIWIHLQLVPV